MPDPSDEEVLHRLRQATPASLERLREAIEAYRAADPASLVEWRGGGPTGEPNTWTLPWPVYDARVDALAGALQDVGAYVVFGWIDWPPAAMVNDVATVAAAPLAHLARFVTCIVRGERFADGTIEAAMNADTLPLIAERLLAELPGLRSAPPR